MLARKQKLSEDDNMKNQESEEMYLETILQLKKKNGSLRSVDIVNERNFARSSVSRAVNLLKDKGYITINTSSGDIDFTETGLKKAENIYDRHRILTKLLSSFGANQDVAEENACRIEHVISEDLFAIIKEYVKKSNLE